LEVNDSFIFIYFPLASCFTWICGTSNSCSL